MTLKHMFLSAAAASSLVLAAAAVEPAVFSLATKAQAATNISTNFYDELAPYGNWLSYHDRYVWIPEDVDDGWRPYTEGHWAYTRRYGWIWVSDEKFGWATYHYGRWGYGSDIGWYWVPGSRWAPAWVAWSYDHYDIAWAPLPPVLYAPVHYDGVNNVISFGDIPDGDIPDYYWQAVQVSAFLSVDLSSHMFRDRDKVRRVIQRGESWTVRIENGIVVNNVIEIDNIEKRTKKKVVALEEKAVDNPDAAGKADSNSVAIFNPEVKEEPNAKPKKFAKIEEVVKEREAKGIPDEEEPEQAATTTDEPVTKPKKDEATGAVAPQDEQQNADQLPATEKKKDATASADQPTKVVQAPAATKPALPPSRTVNLDTIDYDQSGNIVFGGRGPAGSKVQLYVDNNAYGLAFINDKGTWTFAGLSSLTVGSHTLRANEIGGDGAVKSRIEMPFYRDDPAKVATAPQTPAAPQAPKPAEVATAKEVPLPMPPAEMKKKEATASTGQPEIEKAVEMPADEPTAPVEMKKKEATASTDRPDMEKTVEAPAEEQADPVEMKKKEATASIDQPDMDKTVEAPAEKQTVPVEMKNKEATASIDQPAIKKTIKAPADEPPATVTEKKKATASIDQPAIKKNVKAPGPIATVDEKKKATASIDQPKAPEPIAPANEKKEATASIDQPAIKKTIQATVDEPTVPVDGRKKKKKKNALSKLRLQSTQRVIPKTNLRDAGAESWRVNCSPMFGGWSKASETYLSSAGKRVSCAKRPKNARG